MTARELITQYVDTGILLPAYQVNKLNNQDKKTYIRKRLLTVKNGVESLRVYEFNLLSKEEQDKYLLSLSSGQLEGFIINSGGVDVVARLLATNGFIGKLDSEGIYVLLNYGKDVEAVINIILSSNDLINKLNDNSIRAMLKYAMDSDVVINRLLSTSGFINKLGSHGMYLLVRYSEDKVNVINRLLSENGFIDKFVSNNLFSFMLYLASYESVSDRETVINILLSSDELINKLDSGGIENILSRHSNNNDIVINRLLSSTELINKLDSGDIRTLFYYAKDKEVLKNKLMKIGVSKDLINR